MSKYQLSPPRLTYWPTNMGILLGKGRPRACRQWHQSLNPRYNPKSLPAGDKHEGMKEIFEKRIGSPMPREDIDTLHNLDPNTNTGAIIERANYTAHRFTIQEA